MYLLAEDESTFACTIKSFKLDANPSMPPCQELGFCGTKERAMALRPGWGAERPTSES